LTYQLYVKIDVRVSVVLHIFRASDIPRANFYKILDLYGLKL
jgi:hypothetical protein